MLRFLTAAAALTFLPAIANATPVTGIAVPAGKMMPAAQPTRTAKTASAACPPDITKARACHQRQAEMRRAKKTALASN